MIDRRDIDAVVKCITDNLVDCSRPTWFRMASSVMNVRNSAYESCRVHWGEYDKSCDGHVEFKRTKNCIDKLAKKIGQTLSSDYATLCT